MELQQPDDERNRREVRAVARMLARRRGPLPRNVSPDVLAALAEIRQEDDLHHVGNDEGDLHQF